MTRANHRIRRFCAWVQRLLHEAVCPVWGPVCAAVGLTLPCIGCHFGCRTSNVYAGTGALAVNGDLNRVASQHAVVSECPGLAVGDDFAAPFRILAIGDDCIINADGVIGPIQPDPDTVCRLRFSDGSHELRVTNVAVHVGSSFPHYVGRVSVVDISAALVEVGGDDVTTGKHAMYTFSGSIVQAVSSGAICEGQRAKHIAKVPCALRSEDDIALGGPASGERHVPSSDDDIPPGMPAPSRMPPTSPPTAPPSHCPRTVANPRIEGYCPAQ